MQAPRKQSTYYHEQESVAGFDNATNSSDNYYCDTTGYQNYLNEIENV